MIKSVLSLCLLMLVSCAPLPPDADKNGDDRHAPDHQPGSRTAIVRNFSRKCDDVARGLDDVARRMESGELRDEGAVAKAVQQAFDVTNPEVKDEYLELIRDEWDPDKAADFWKTQAASLRELRELIEERY